jgi:hypothetical protein
MARTKRPPKPPRIEDLIADALEDGGEALYFSASDLDALGVDDAALEDVLDRLQLYSMEFDGRGGVLIAGTPDVLEAKQELISKRKPIPVFPVRKHARRGA